MDWTNSGELLAVAGKFREIAVKSNHTIRYLNVLHFYNDIGQMVYKVDIPCETVSSPALFINIRDLPSMKCSGKILQNWLYSIPKENPSNFFLFPLISPFPPTMIGFVVHFYQWSFNANLLALMVDKIRLLTSSQVVGLGTASRALGNNFRPNLRKT